MNNPVQEITKGTYATIYWHRPGGSRDPKDFFDAQEKRTRLSLLATFAHFAHSGTLGVSRGHPEGWEFETLGHGPLLLYKFKDDPRIRFYAVVFPVGSKRAVVLVYGFQVPKKGMADREHKRRAERAAIQYVTPPEPG